jgi:hypothetical protein
MFRVEISWSKRRETLIAHNEDTLAKLLSWHNDRPKGQGYCRVKLLSRNPHPSKFFCHVKVVD